MRRGEYDTFNAEDLRREFSRYGPVTRADITIDKETGWSKGFGFVSFANVESADAAIAAINGSWVDGCAAGGVAHGGGSHPEAEYRWGEDFGERESSGCYFRVAGLPEQFRINRLPRALRLAAPTASACRRTSQRLHD
jgi:RNA recognition motif-containing protein